MKAHRALLIRLSKDKCDVEHIRRLIALTNIAYRGFEVLVPDLLKNIQYQLYGFKNYMGSLVFGTEPKRWFTKVWVPLKTLRIYSDGSKKGDKSAPVVLEFRSDVDFKSNVIRLRQICRNEPRYTVEVPMPRWVIDRIREGGDIKFAMIGLKNGEPYLALIAEREVAQYTPSEYRLVVDVNSWKYGISWGLIRNGRIVSYKQEGLNLGRYYGLYDEFIRLGREYGELRRSGLHRTIEGRRLWKRIRAMHARLYAITRDKAYFLASKLVRKALKYKALLIIDDMTEESRKELLEEKLPSDVIKLLMSNLKRFVHQLETLARWYGVPYEFKRLPSTVCPVCQHELTQLPGRTMVCTNCGFKAPRDKVPIHWALRAIPRARVGLP
ncbi:MAG: zinc ribbon domain-containing protein [Vulcanisaeta sp.]